MPEHLRQDNCLPGQPKVKKRAVVGGLGTDQGVVRNLIVARRRRNRGQQQGDRQDDGQRQGDALRRLQRRLGQDGLDLAKQSRTQNSNQN